MEKHAAQSGHTKRQPPQFLSQGRVEKGLHGTGMTLKTRFAQVTIPQRQFHFYWALKDASDIDYYIYEYFKSIFG